MSEDTLREPILTSRDNDIVEEDDDAFDVEALPPSIGTAYTPRAGGRGLRGSVYAGDSRKFKAKRTQAWASSMAQMESLDYELVDNKVFRNRGRHKASVTKWFTTIAAGVGIGATAFFIEFCIAKLGDLRLSLLTVAAGDKGNAASVAWYALSGGAFAMASSLGVLMISPPAVGAGVSLVMANLNGLNVPGLLSTETLLTKVFGTILSVSSGLPVGPEGPLVHVGACISSFFTHQHSFTLKLFGKRIFSFKSHQTGLDFFHNDHDRRDFLSCGAAAGLAAAFGAPIGGVLFSLEEASTFWSQTTTWHTLVCTSLATFTLTLLHGGKVLSSPGLIKFDQVKHGFNWWELFLFAILAAFMGLLGAIFNGGFKRLAPYRPKSKQGKLIEVTTLVLICNCIWAIPYFYPHMFGASTCMPRPASADYDDIKVDALITYCKEDEFNDWAMLSYGPRETVIKLLLKQSAKHEGAIDTHFEPGCQLYLGIVYFIALLAASDCAVPAGFFMPGILIGACWGGASSYVFQEFINLFPTPRSADGSPHPILLNAGLYALVGATAMLAGLFRSAISLVVIMLEGTGNIQYLLPLLVAVTAAKTVGNMFNDSIYHIQLHMKKIPFLEPAHGEPQEGSLDCGDIMASEVVTFERFEKVRLVEYALKSTHNGFPIVKLMDDKFGVQRRHFMGMIYRSQILTLLGRRVMYSEDEVENLKNRLVALQAGAEPGTSLDHQDDEVSDEQSDLDAAMRTYFHRHTFYNRTAETGAERVELIGLTEDEREMFIDLGPFMNISPMTVQKETSVWRAFKYFHTMGLRHITVVDEYNSVLGMLTRKDFVKTFEKHH